MGKKALCVLVLVTALIVSGALAGACGGVAGTEVRDGKKSDSSFDTATSVPREKLLEIPSKIPEELSVLWEVWALLNQDHINRDGFDADVFTESAIQGLLSALNDPHTNYVRPEAFQIENEELTGQFEGIGATVSLRQDGKLIIVAPIDNSPAKVAGIKPGDLILAVDGQDIEGLSLLESVALIRGPKGTNVTLLVQHLGEVDPIQIVITRGIIPVESVLLRSDPGARIAHIRITNFLANTAESLASVIQQAVDGGAEGLIIDVRDNPGGLLQSVVDVASHFIEDGVILFEMDGDGRRKDFNAKGEGVALTLPLVVLANQFSASASEILVGAIQDHKRATVIGTSTFGKGSVNILRKLRNEGGLIITHSRWFTPSGRMIQPDGLKPDIEVSDLDAKEADILQLQKAMDVMEAQLDD